ncbi:MAG: DNA recombination protein RmuC, partial [Ferruginibacter sp.]
LYDKFVGFLENLEQVGKKLEDASNCYNSAFKQLSSGRGNIITRVEELKKMGANANKQLPVKLLAELNNTDE